MTFNVFYLVFIILCTMRVTTSLMKYRLKITNKRDFAVDLVDVLLDIILITLAVMVGFN